MFDFNSLMTFEKILASHGQGVEPGKIRTNGNALLIAML